MTPADAIKTIRYELRLTQEELADQIGCKQNTISFYEQGKRVPSYEVLKRLNDLAKKNKLNVTFLWSVSA